MPFVKGNTIGQATRFKTGESGNPAGRPPDKLRRFIYAELDKVEREATGKHEAVTKLQVLAERIVEGRFCRLGGVGHGVRWRVGMSPQRRCPRGCWDCWTRWPVHHGRTPVRRLRNESDPSCQHDRVRP